MKNNRAIATIDTTNTNIITFGAKWDMFIIPNPAHSLLDDWMPAAYAEKMVYAMANLDKANFNPGLTIGEKMVQVWYCNDKCENGVRHYPHVTDQDGKRWDIKFDIGEYFPESFAKRLHEGETRKFNIPVTLEYWDEETDETEERKAIMLCEITAKQKAYRYRMFGTFEETLKRVLL